jgi:hypothetical protein
MKNAMHRISVLGDLENYLEVLKRRRKATLNVIQ